MLFRHLLAVVLFAAALPAFAAAPTVNNMSVQEFLAFHDEVARKSTTREFEALPRSEREALVKAQAELRAALAGKTSMSELDDAGRLIVFNAHESVVALVNKAEDERMVCTQKKRLGSHRHTLECRTVAQLKEDRNSARDERLRQQSAACTFNCGN